MSDNKIDKQTKREFPELNKEVEQIYSMIVLKKVERESIITKLGIKSEIDRSVYLN